MIMHTAFTAHNIRPDDGSETLPEAGRTMDQSTVLRSVRKMLDVIYPDGLAGKTIVDIGCLEGGYATEFARMGMTATGIEVRESNYRNCLHVKSRVDLGNLHFIHGDANNIDAHGNFDVFFINGLLYHLDRPRRFLEKVSRYCDKAVFIQTHVANAGPSEAVRIHGLSELGENEGLRGRWYPEYDAVDPAQLDQMKWSSWSNNRSFWIQKEYLLGLLKLIGFDVVLEQFDFMEDIVGEMTGGFYRTNDRVMLVGIKSGGNIKNGIAESRGWHPFVVPDAAPDGFPESAPLVVPPDAAPAPEHAALKAENAALHAALAGVHASTSWRITRPLRALGRLLHPSGRRARQADAIMVRRAVAAEFSPPDRVASSAPISDR